MFPRIGKSSSCFVFCTMWFYPCKCPQRHLDPLCMLSVSVISRSVSRSSMGPYVCLCILHGFWPSDLYILQVLVLCLLLLYWGVSFVLPVQKARSSPSPYPLLCFCMCHVKRSVSVPGRFFVARHSRSRWSRVSSSPLHLQHSLQSLLLQMWCSATPQRIFLYLILKSELKTVCGMFLNFRVFQICWIGFCGNLAAHLMRVVLWFDWQRDRTFFLVLRLLMEWVYSEQ